MLDIADIRSIDTQVGISAQRNLAYPDPQDEMEARFSMQYCLATAFVHGKLRLADFTPEAAARPELRDLMSRISMTAYTPEQEKGVERLPHRVTVNTCDGRHLSVERLHAKGAIEAPLDEADREYKFRDCLGLGKDLRSLDSVLAVFGRAPAFRVCGSSSSPSQITPALTDPIDKTIRHREARS